MRFIITYRPENTPVEKSIYVEKVEDFYYEDFQGNKYKIIGDEVVGLFRKYGDFISIEKVR